MQAKDLHIRDPFIFMENDTYYLLGTTGDACWEGGSDLKLYASKDLEEFTVENVLVEPALLDGYTNVWAPEIHKIDGKYYLVVSLYRKDLGRGSVILVSDSLTEKFTFLTGEYITPAGWGCLDATLFVYQGEKYVCFSNEWTTPITGDGDGSLFIAKLSPDLKRIVTKPKKIVSGKYHPLTVAVGGEECRGVVAEGPYLYEEKGKIVLLWSGFTKTGYSIFRSTATEVLGEYSVGELIYEKDGGHCMRFVGYDGKERIIFHQPNVTGLERIKLI